MANLFSELNRINMATGARETYLPTLGRSTTMEVDWRGVAEDGGGWVEGGETQTQQVAFRHSLSFLSLRSEQRQTDWRLPKKKN